MRAPLSHVSPLRSPSLLHRAADDALMSQAMGHIRDEGALMQPRSPRNTGLARQGGLFAAAGPSGCDTNAATAAICSRERTSDVFPYVYPDTSASNFSAILHGARRVGNGARSARGGAIGRAERLEQVRIL